MLTISNFSNHDHVTFSSNVNYRIKHHWVCGATYEAGYAYFSRIPEITPGLYCSVFSCLCCVVYIVVWLVGFFLPWHCQFFFDQWECPFGISLIFFVFWSILLSMTSIRYLIPIILNRMFICIGTYSDDLGR